jgi:hypothetical protein
VPVAEYFSIAHLQHQYLRDEGAFVVVGGIGTMAVALLWMKLFPTPRRVERLDGAIAP